MHTEWLAVLFDPRANSPNTRFDCAFTGALKMDKGDGTWKFLKAEDTATHTPSAHRSQCAYAPSLSAVRAAGGGAPPQPVRLRVPRHTGERRAFFCPVLVDPWALL